MRNYDELIATENIFDWTPDELYMFVHTVAKDIGQLKQSYAREKLVKHMSKLHATVLDAIEQQSLNELRSIEAEAQQKMIDAINGAYDYGQK